MCVCACVLPCVRTYVHAGVYVWLAVCLSRVCACVRMSVRTDVHVCMYVWLVSCLSVCPMCGRAYVRACLSVGQCASVPVSVSLSVRYVHACVRSKN